MEDSLCFLKSLSPWEEERDLSTWTGISRRQEQNEGKGVETEGMIPPYQMAAADKRVERKERDFHLVRESFRHGKWQNWHIDLQHIDFQEAAKTPCG